MCKVFGCILNNPAFVKSVVGTISWKIEEIATVRHLFFENGLFPTFSYY